MVNRALFLPFCSSLSYCAGDKRTLGRRQYGKRSIHDPDVCQQGMKEGKESEQADGVFCLYERGANQCPTQAYEEKGLLGGFHIRTYWLSGTHAEKKVRKTSMSYTRF